MGFAFVRMNGLGNDFTVVPDAEGRFSPTAAEVRALADRSRPTGCDQLIAITRSDRAPLAMRIWNADGGEARHCGNGARGVAWLAMRAAGTRTIRIEAPAGILDASLDGEDRVTVDMGEPAFGWRDIPLAEPMDTLALPVAFFPALGHGSCVSMGNPHVVFFVADLAAVPLAHWGAAIERHALFPERVNVGFAEVGARDLIRLRVYERGAGLTQACGTGACAALVAAARRGLTGRAARIEMAGGDLDIDWSAADGRVRMSGPVAVDHTGHLRLDAGR